MTSSIYHAAYISIALGFLRKILGKTLSPYSREPGTKLPILHVVLLRPGLPPYPVAVCAGGSTATRIAVKLNLAKIPGIGATFTFTDPKAIYSVQATDRIRKAGFIPMVQSISLLDIPAKSKNSLLSILNSLTA